MNELKTLIRDLELNIQEMVNYLNDNNIDIPANVMTDIIMSLINMKEAIKQ